jgi:amino acid adenylation domain-containing protein
MTDLSRIVPDIPPDQEAIRARCFHPTGTFVAFGKEEVEQSISRRFEQIVRLYPNRLAIKTKSRALTYDSLDRLANRIANSLVVRSAQREESVAVLLEHGADIIAALVGVLKSGKVYVPLDPVLPHARTRFIREHTRAKLIVTNTLNLSAADEISAGDEVLNIDELVDSADDNPGISVSPDNTAYILYTSGSAGEPKGVVQTHRNLLHQVRKETNALHVSAEDRLTLLRSCSVIGGVRVALTSLLNGAAVYPLNIAGEGYGKLEDLLKREETTIYDSAATTFRHFVGTLPAVQAFPKLRLIRISSETVYQRDVALYKKHFSPNCIFVNSLGITETTGTIRNYFIDQNTPAIADPVPVGYPIEDMEILLLDEHGHEVGLGGTAEIAVRSRYLSPGYWRRPDLTQVKFLPDAPGSNRRIYLTGDLGRMLPDGCLLHLGRKDFQVKVRGYSIDTAEVELALRGVDGIKEAVVVTRRDRSDEPYLAAYVIGANPPPTIGNLRQALSQRLPDYMIPAAFVMLDALPLTPTGKVDRSALPAPSRSRPELDTAFVAPRTPAERQLVQIWSEVLSLDHVGIRDNFFDLGGHSLAATQVVSQVIKAFQLELPLELLFKSPTIAEMAALIIQYQGRQLGVKDMDLLLSEVEELSEEEANRLAEGGTSGSKQ